MSTFGSKLPAQRPSLRFSTNCSKVSLDELDSCRQRVTRLGPCSDAKVYSHNHSVSNWKRGLIKRVAPKEKPIDPDVMRRFKEFMKDKIRHMPVAPGGQSFEVLQEDWLSHSNYNGKRREQLRRKATEVFNHEVPRYKILRVESFIKSEFYDELKECRIINSRSDWFKAVVGPYIHLVEKYVYDRHFIKHCLPSEVAQKMTEVARGYDLFYETDYSSFESSFSIDVMVECELAMFKHVLANYPEAISYIESAYKGKNFVFFKGDKTQQTTATFKGSRMSGEMWTSLCNGFTNKCLVEFMFRESNTYGDFLVEGDDGFICSKHPINTKLVDDLGFTLKIQEESDPTRVKFCSLSVCDGKIVPDVPRVLSHYGKINDMMIADCFRRATKRSLKNVDELMKAKAQSLLATSRGIPILQAVAVQQLKIYSKTHLNPKYFDWWEKTFFDLCKPVSPSKISLTMRKFVQDNFGISIDRQIEIESHIMKCKEPVYDIYLGRA